MARIICLLICLVIPGLLVACVAGYYSLVDWSQLQTDYHHYQAVAGSNADMKTVVIAYNAQDIHRTNLFADGVWAMLGIILAGIGVSGLCNRMPRR